MATALSEQKRQFADGIPECGADALRMALCSYNFKGLRCPRGVKVKGSLDSLSDISLIIMLRNLVP